MRDGERTKRTKGECNLSWRVPRKCIRVRCFKTAKTQMNLRVLKLLVVSQSKSVTENFKITYEVESVTSLPYFFWQRPFFLCNNTSDSMVFQCFHSRTEERWTLCVNPLLNCQSLPWLFHQTRYQSLTAELKHYENTPIQIYWKFYHENMKIFR